MTSPTTGRLLRLFGVTFGLAVILGNTIGAGILRTPGQVAANLPTPALYLSVWILGGLYALLGANAFAELGTLLPESGGQYVFVRRALGDYAGFIVGWSDWLSTCGTSAAVSLVIAEYGAALFPPLVGARIAIAAALVAIFALLQLKGVRSGGTTQLVTTLLKTAAFAALIAACFLFGEGIEPLKASGKGIPLLSLLVALQAVIYTYDGWSGVIYFSEEIREPARDIPRSLFGGALLVTAVYLLVNLGFLYTTPVARLAGEPLAAAVVAERIFGSSGEQILRVLVIVSLLSSLNAYHLMATRVIFAMARDRLAPAAAVAINAGGTPSLALLASAGAALLFLLSGTFERAVALLSFFFVANYTLSFLSLFVLRRVAAALPRPYRAWGHPWTTALALVSSIAFLGAAILADRHNSLIALLLLALSYPVYRLVRRR